MGDEETVLSLMIIAQQIKNEAEKEKKRKRRKWMKKWLQEKEKFSNQKLIKQLKTEEPADYRNFLRMNDDAFKELLGKIKYLIKKEDTQMRDAIPPETRLCITLRYLAKGSDFEDLKFFYAVSPQAIGKIIPETCRAIIFALKDLIKIPTTEDQWCRVSEHFYALTGFPHCLGAIDGKHVEIKKPAHSGSYFFNYKKTFSIVLMAVVNANYEFLMVDVGKNGRISDGGVFSSTSFAKKLQSNSLNIPDPSEIIPGGEKLPYVFIGDDAFPLKENLMKPYSSSNLSMEEELFNKTLSSARVKIENVFGILANRFEVLMKPIKLCPEKATMVVLACCYIHNYLRKQRGDVYTTKSPTETKSMETGLQSTKAKNSLSLAKDVRNNFRDFINLNSK